MTIEQKPTNTSTGNSLAEKYEHAYHEVWGALAKWKQVAIEDDKKNGKLDGRLLNEFVHEVQILAEK